MSFLSETYEGLAGGSNLRQPAQSLLEIEARFIQDALVDRPGICRQRGPVTEVPNLAAAPSRLGSGLAFAVDPVGEFRIGVVNGDASNGYLSVYSDDYSTLEHLALPHALNPNPPSSPYPIADIKATLTGGSWIGISNTYGAENPAQALVHWRGANKPEYSTGTITVERESTGVSGSGTLFSQNVVPGMFLFADTDEGYTNTYVGVVLEVNSDFSFTLGLASPYALTDQSYTLKPIRGFQYIVSTGRITFDTSDKTVTGGATKFGSQGMGTGTWNVYLAGSNKWVGEVETITNDTSLELSSNPSFSGYNERYYALRADGDWTEDLTDTLEKPGFLNAVYAERQWYANRGNRYEYTYRLWYSDTNSPESVDFSVWDGSFIDIGSSSGPDLPIQALAPAANGLVVLKEREAFIVVGQTPSSFTPRKLEDDGTLSAMSVQSYGGGVIWAGRQGIHFFDGVEVENLTEARLGDFYRNIARSFDPNEYRMWSMLARNHYFLFMERIVSPQATVTKGVDSLTPNNIGIVINMTTRAITFSTNINLRGAIELPASTGQGIWYLINDGTKWRVCTTEGLFDTYGFDEIASDGGTAGPDYYIEFRKFDAGDGMRLKKWMRFALNAVSLGGDLNIDVVPSLGEVGTLLADQFTATSTTWDALGTTYATWNALSAVRPTWDSLNVGVYLPRRVLYDRRATHISFRLYGDGNVEYAAVGPYGVFYKPMREGRVDAAN